MKNQITTKDLGVLNELILFEQWAATKFRHYYDMVDEEDLKELFRNVCLEHNERHDALFNYLKDNADAKGGK